MPVHAQTGADCAVVTGASSGIGRATAIELSRDLPVIAVARNADALAQTAARAPGEVQILAADLTTDAGLAGIAAALAQRQVRFLVHGAGVYPIDSIASLSAATWRQVMATNLDARLFLTQRLSAHFVRGTRVLFVGSLSAHKGRKGGIAYCTSKAASFMLQQCLRLEFAERGVLFANTYPGFVDTPLMHGAINADPATMPDSAEYAAAAARGELIDPHTVGLFYRWLLSETSDAEYNREDWKVLDPAHRGRWLGERSPYAGPGGT